MKSFYFNQKSGSGILLLFTLLAPVFSQAQNNIVYPAAAGVVNMVSQYGLVPNNSSQASANTLKIQKAINEHKGRRNARINQVLYFPNGTYFINDKITLGSGTTDDIDSTEARELTIQGQSESGTVIKLVNGSVGYGTGEAKPLLAFFEGTGWNAAMGNYLNNITIDIGSDNPGAIGVDFHNNNYGSIYDVTIKSSDAQKKGAIGLKMNRELTGIGYIKNVRIEGFDIGIKTGSFKIAYTMEYIDLEGQRVAGIENTDKPLQIRKLTSINSVPAIINKTRQGHIVLIDSHLGGGSSAFPAIDNQQGFLFLRNITSIGYQMTVKDGGLNKDAALNDDGEYSSHGAVRLWAATPLKSMNLDVKDAPEVTWDAPSDWAVVDPNANGKADDANAIQAAINSGKSTVCVKSGDIFINKSIVFPSGHRVKRFIVFGRIAALGIDPVFIIQTGTREALVIQGIRTWYANNPIQFFQNNSTKTVILRHNGIYGSTKVYRNGPGAGTLFIEDMATLPGGKYSSQQPGPAFQFDNQEVYARSYDPENALPFTVNNGGRLWVLGFKTEGTGISFVTKNGGFTEVLGGEVNGTITGEHAEMIFNDNSHVSFIAAERANATSRVRQTVIREKRGSEERVFTFGQLDTVSGPRFVPSSVIPLYVGYDPVAVSKTRTLMKLKAGEKENLGSELSLQAFTNPVLTKTTIRYGLPEAAMVLLEIYDLAGTKVSTLVNGKQQAGNQKISYDSSLLAEGIYLIKLAAGNQYHTLKLINN